MPPVLIVEHQPVADALFGLGRTIIGFEIDLLMFQSAPEALDKHIVHPASLAIHADLDVMVFEYIREVLAGKLTAASRLLDKRHENTFLECQSMIATRYTKPLRIGMYVRSVHHT